MIVIMKKGALPENVSSITNHLEKQGFSIHLSTGVERTIIGAVGDKTNLDRRAIEAFDGVEKVVSVLKPYKLASREFHPDDTTITVGDVVIGGGQLQVIAGPCAVETEEQLFSTALAVKAAGATILRGGAFKPRSSPYAFQGLGEQGLKLLAMAKEQTGLALISEVMDTQTIDLVAGYVDILQIGARNMQNFSLLKAVAQTNKPIMLKRGMSASFEEWLMAAEYILANGNKQVILCERGIKTFESYTRNTLDLAAIPVIKQLTHLPIIVDPSHATGKWDLVAPLAKAAVIAGADGLMIEVHPEPTQALCDGPQSLKPHKFADLMHELGPIAQLAHSWASQLG